MQRAEQVLDILERQAMRPGFQFHRLYRNLFNPDLYRYAAQTASIEIGSQTSERAVQGIIASMRAERYRPGGANASRTSTADRLVIEAVSLILQALLGPVGTPSDAFQAITGQWAPIRHGIAGRPAADASQHAASIAESLSSRIADGRFLRLLKLLLHSGAQLPPLFNHWLQAVDAAAKGALGRAEYVRCGGHFLFGIRADCMDAITVPSIAGIKITDCCLANKRSLQFLGCSVYGSPSLGIPDEILNEEIRWFSRHGQPAPRSEWIHLPEPEIQARYFTRLREFMRYYRFVRGWRRRTHKLQFYVLASLAMTLAQKLRITRRQAYRAFDLRARWNEALAQLEMID